MNQVSRESLVPLVRVLAKRLGFVALFALASSGAAFAADDSVATRVDIATSGLIVKYRDPALISAARAGLAPDQVKLDRLSTVLGETVRFGRAMAGDAYVFRLSRRLPPAEAEAAAAKIALEPDVEYAQPDRILRHHLVPNDTLYG